MCFLLKILVLAAQARPFYLWTHPKRECFALEVAHACRSHNSVGVLCHSSCKIFVLRVPGAQQPSHQHQFAQMVRVVIGHQQRLAKDGLPVAMSDRGKQVR
jgi:hypothetical protein